MAEELWYYEKLTLGRWWPRTEPQPPNVRTSEGSRPKIRGVIKVDPRHVDCSLKALRRRYSREGDLIYTQGPEHVKKVMSLP